MSGWALGWLSEEASEGALEGASESALETDTEVWAWGVDGLASERASGSASEEALAQEILSVRS